MYKAKLPLNTNRSSQRRCSVKSGFLRNFAKFTGKHLCKRLFFDKVVGLRSATLLKKSLWHRHFHMTSAQFLSTPFLRKTSERLLLNKEKLCWYKLLIKRIIVLNIKLNFKNIFVWVEKGSSWIILQNVGIPQPPDIFCKKRCY